LIKVYARPMSPLSHRSLTRSLLTWCLLLGWAAGDGQLAAAADVETLPAAQTRLRFAQEQLEDAQLQVRREEQHLKEAQESLARQQKRLEDEQLKVERSKSALADAKARVDQAKQKHDQAYADIQRLYRERQQTPNPAPANTKPQSN